MDKRQRLKRREFLMLMGSGSCAMALDGFAHAPSTYAKETYLRGKITWIVGYQPGGGNDILASGISPFMQKYLKEASAQPDTMEIVIKC